MGNAENNCKPRDHNGQNACFNINRRHKEIRKKHSKDGYESVTTFMLIHGERRDKLG
jgi:hypothetical protein